MNLIRTSYLALLLGFFAFSFFLTSYTSASNPFTDVPSDSLYSEVINNFYNHHFTTGNTLMEEIAGNFWNSIWN